MTKSIDRRKITLFVTLMSALTLFFEAHADSARYSEETIQFSGADVVLDGAILLPDGPGPFAGVVMVHGAGPATREDVRADAEIFTDAGIAALIYDKRVAGYDGSGFGETSRSYALLADDALAAVATLRAHPAVDPDKVGLWGFSEGGWVAPLAASRSDDVAFLITVGANGLSPIQQTSWSMERLFRLRGVSSGSFIRAFSRHALRVLNASELFAEANYDPMPALGALRQPVLALWGNDETSTPPAESAELFLAAFEQSGHPSYTLRFFPDAGHGIRHHETLTGEGPLAPGYAEAMTGWVAAVVAGDIPPPAVVDGPPAQAFRSSAEVTQPGLVDSGLLHLAILLALVVAFVGYLALTAVRRARRSNPSSSSLGRAGLLLSLLGLLVVGGFFLYFGWIIMSYDPGPVALGQPIVWLLLTVASLAVVALTVWLLATAWRRWPALAGSDRARFGLLLAGGLLFIPWALYWQLLLPWA